MNPGRKKRFSPAAHFIRTGEIRPGFDKDRVLKVGVRLLSKTWHDTAKKKKPSLPLPSFEERINGGVLGREEMQEIHGQLNFVLKSFVAKSNKLEMIE